MTIVRTFRKSLLLVTSLLLLGGPMRAENTDMTLDHSVDGVLIEAAWSPVAPPGIKTSALYLSLTNLGCANAVLVSVESPDFMHAHLHKSSMSGGMATMEAVVQVEVPAGKTAVFEPGGLHVMLMGAKRSLGLGETFPVTLGFQDGRKISVIASVTAPGKQPDASEHSMDGHDHGSMHMN
ncbi:copper chaperone PCu(A)C [Roseibium sp.]|uniref:copper chaperone PCu(A)C n=1 Tax=Roseibium sp. TaxID=1936156 RepID=UPI003A9873E2